MKATTFENRTKELKKYNVSGEIIEAKTKKEAVETYLWYCENRWMTNEKRSFSTLYKLTF